MIAPRQLRDADGTVHFSTLKRFARSAGHYRHAIETPFASSRPMRVGTVGHLLTLGAHPGRLVVRYEGKSRSGKEWESFRLRHASPTVEIVTAAEWEDAEPCAAAVLADPVARRWLDGARYEVPLQWEEAGVPCSTSGVDVLRDDAAADLKFTGNASERKFLRHAEDMAYHAQLAFYRRGLRANGKPVERFALIACEFTAPHPVTVYVLDEAVLELGDRMISAWLEGLQRAEENDFWPCGPQSEVPWKLAEKWGAEAEAEADEDEEGEEAAQ